MWVGLMIENRIFGLKKPFAVLIRPTEKTVLKQLSILIFLGSNLRNEWQSRSVCTCFPFPLRPNFIQRPGSHHKKRRL